MPSPLDSAHVDVPCKVPWDSMLALADEAVRWCTKCKSNVYDVASMTREHAEQVLRDDAPSCMRLFRRPDGTVLTKDCSPPRFRGFAPGFAPMLGRVVMKPKADPEGPDVRDLVDEFISGDRSGATLGRMILRIKEAKRRTKDEAEVRLAEAALDLFRRYGFDQITGEELHAELEDALEASRPGEGA